MDSENGPQFRVKLATTNEELRAAQRLRYRVFIEELGGDGPMVDHAAGLEQDRFDPFFDHLILIDDAKNSDIVGVYRLLRDDQAERAGQFYSEDEYDLGVLRRSGRRLMELGRSCLDPGYRGGAAMLHLWNGLGRYVTDPQALAQPLSLLHHRHLAPAGLRVRAHEAHFQAMDMIAEADLDRRAAMVQVPALIKAYLRLGGYVGEGAFVDHSFNTTDICLVMDARKMSDRNKGIYTNRVTR